MQMSSVCESVGLSVRERLWEKWLIFIYYLVGHNIVSGRVMIFVLGRQTFREIMVWHMVGSVLDVSVCRAT